MRLLVALLMMALPVFAWATPSTPTSLRVAQGPFPDPFSQPPVPLATLTVTKSGTGNGTVSGVGIDCGSDCSHTYNRGVQVTLGVSPTSGSFTGWSGACTGTGSCVVTMDQARSVTATFTVEAGGTIASQFPGDANIETHPDVLFVERFEDSVAGISGRLIGTTSTGASFVQGTMGQSQNSAGMSLSSTVPSGSPGTSSLLMTTSGPAQSYFLTNIADAIAACNATPCNEVYFRVLVQYVQGAYHHAGLWLLGNGVSDPDFAMTTCCDKPSATDARFYIGVEPQPFPEMELYTGWQSGRYSGIGGCDLGTDGTTECFFGNAFLPASVTTSFGQWRNVELRWKKNSAPTVKDGEMQLWLDDVEIINLRQGAPTGAFSGNTWVTGAGAPFEGFDWAATSTHKLTNFWLLMNADTAAGGQTTQMRWDHLVVARSRIGALVPASPGGGGNVTVVASNTASGSSATAALSITPSGADRALTVVVTRDATATVTSCTFAGQSLTFIGAATPTDGFGRTERWRLLNPPAQAGTVSCALSASTAWVIGARAYSGVLQSMSTADFAFTSATGTSTTPSVTIASTAGEIVEDALGVSLTAGQTATVGANQTAQWNTTLSGQILGAGSTEVGAASVPMTWTLSQSLPWSISAIRLRLSGPPDTTPPTTPGSLLATPQSSQSIALTVGTACTDANAITYRIERSTNTCTAFSEIATDPAPFAYTDTGLSASTTYCYRVRCEDAGGNLSGYSNNAQATTLVTRTINLAWNDTNSSPNEEGTEVWFCTGSGCDPSAGTLLLTTGPNVTTASHTTAPNGVTVGYAVRAIHSTVPASAYSATLYIP